MFTLCVLFGKFCAAGAFTILHIATAELYPTAIRLNFSLTNQIDNLVQILTSPCEQELDAWRLLHDCEGGRDISSLDCSLPP